MPSDYMPSDGHRGFTLIELLVVIAVIGILASVVVIAVDPVEQINRAKDAKMKQDVAALYQVAYQYYTISGGTVAPAVGAPLYQQTFINSGEIKAPISSYADHPGPYYNDPVVGPWMTGIDFEVGSGELYSKQSLIAAKAEYAIIGGSCDGTKTHTVFYAYFKQNGVIHYYCY